MFMTPDCRVGDRVIHVRTTLLVIAFCGLGGAVTGQSTAGKSRLLRMLTGRSEPVRLSAVYKLRQNRQALNDSLDDLLQALQIQADSLVDSELPPSMAELIYLVGSVDRSESEAALVESLDSPCADIAMIAADVLGKYQFVGAYR